MTLLNNWVISPNNHGHSCWSTNKGGIPEIKPKWQIDKCAKYGAGWEFCATDTQIYINSADLLSVALDIETGEKIWEVILPDEATSSIAINANQICIAPYVLNQENGKIVDDLTRYGYSFQPVEDVANEIFFINTTNEKKGVLCYHDTGYEFYDIPAGAITSIGDGKRIVGIESGSLVCYSLEESRKQWSLRYPIGEDGSILSPSSASYMVINHKIYMHVNYDTLRCVNIDTGDIIWQSGPSTIDENKPPLYRKAPSRFLGCEDTLYLGRDISDDGFLQARSVEDGRELWKVDASQARLFLIAGDLIFGALNDVPVAWDRHTGEVVWNANKPMTAIFHAVAASNKIIYTNTMSQMRCYEWTAPYHSPEYLGSV
ncbi:MAG: PQQ-binding-like beta-propeller repeat protein [Candidatus Thiodiazotropha sp. (ex Monitilora ramsayi)]|nr:PQQ-binding-like beta-propeller repeat protein [Candidatus Thiodiazotropha sp. (ex Monitilora ramsayi)]